MLTDVNAFLKTLPMLDNVYLSIFKWSDLKSGIVANLFLNNFFF